MPNKYAQRLAPPPLLVAKSPDPEGARDVCFRDTVLRTIAEDAAKKSPAPPSQDKAQTKKPEKKRR